MSLRSLLKRLAPTPAPTSLELMCQRFMQVFHQHGVETSQIPRLVPQLRLDDLQSSERLLAALTPAILDQVASLFDIRIQWLEGIEDEIYEYLSCYKRPIRILKHLRRLLHDDQTKDDQPIRVLCTTKHLDYRSSAVQEIAFVLLEKIAEFGEENIYRYHVYRDGGSWDHYRFRIESKAVARIVFHRLGIPVTLFEISEQEMSELLEGRCIPASLCSGCLLSSPSLEDYALDVNESGVAKETDELPAVLAFIEDDSELKDFSFTNPHSFAVDATPEPEAAPESTQQAEGKVQKGKRADAKTQIWEPARNAARTIWTQEPKLSIAEVVGRIKGMSFLKASVLGESAIRKHISDLAPPGVAGKPGRKPKKSS